ncbi:MAG: hypothetical protein V4454_18840 [Pseudomonadota bacterium]
MPTLRAIVSVDPEHRVWCSEVGCGHTVHKAVHVVQDGKAIFILGSTCFAKKYGGATALGGPSYGGGGGRQLTDAERELLANNTAALLAQFEAEVEEEGRLRRQTLSRKIPPPLIARPIKQKPATLVSTGSFNSPWPWAGPGRSMFYIHFPDGTGWIRVEHKDGEQRLVPWPKFEGWDETWPEIVGKADHELGCLYVRDFKSALEFLRQSSAWDKVYGSWRELKAELDRLQRPNRR